MLRAALVSLLAAFALVSVASAHVERPSYFPDPAADTAVSPAAGGDVPRIRRLSSSVVRKYAGTTRVVCQPNSLSLVKRAVAVAQSEGYSLRPSEQRRKIRPYTERLIMSVNRCLKKQC